MDLLADSITQFAVTNSALRCALREQRDHDLSLLRLSEQRDALLNKLARSQDTCQVHRLQTIYTPAWAYKYGTIKHGVLFRNDILTIGTPRLICDRFLEDVPNIFTILEHFKPN